VHGLAVIEALLAGGVGGPADDRLPGAGARPPRKKPRAWPSL